MSLAFNLTAAWSILSSVSELLTEQITAVANIVLAAGAIVTSIFAIRAFRAQRREVQAIEQQVKDQEDLSQQQADLLRIQSEQLDVQRTQLKFQRDLNTEQAEVFKLQARDLRQSLEERKRSQASAVTAWFSSQPPVAVGDDIWGSRISNASELPVYDVRTAFYYVSEPVKGLGWEPVSQGVSTEMIRVLPPRSERFLAIPETVRNQITECNDSVYAVSITFTDAAGNRWERDPKGVLRPLA